MDELLASIGTITFLNTDEEKEKKKLLKKKSKEKSDENTSEKNKCSAKIKIVFDGEPELLCIAPSSQENELFPKKKKHSYLKDKAIYFVAYLNSNGHDRGYYYDEETGEVLIFDKSDKYTFHIYIGIVDEKSDGDFSDITEYYFSGDSAFRIEEDVDFIKKSYCSDNTKQMIALLVVSFGIVLFGMYYLLFSEEDAPPPPPPPRIPALSNMEIMKLKSIATVDSISKMKKTIKEIQESELTNDGKQRIIVFSQKKASVLSPETARRRGDGTYYYLHPKLKGGAIKIKTDVSYQMSYPMVGYVLSGKDTYLKSETVSETYSKTQIPMEVNPLSEKCIQDVLHISKSGDSFVYQRFEDNIIFKFKDMKASLFIDKIESIASKCPMFIEDVSISGGKFQGDIVLFAKEGINR